MAEFRTSTTTVVLENATTSRIGVLPGLTEVTTDITDTTDHN